MASTNTDFFLNKRTVSINITYQYCPERLKLGLFGRRETRIHYLGLIRCQNQNTWRWSILGLAVCLTIVQVLTIKMTFTFRILYCLTLDVSMFHFPCLWRSVLKRNWYLLRCLNCMLQQCPFPVIIVFYSCLCFPEALILEQLLMDPSLVMKHLCQFQSSQFYLINVEKK